MFRIGGLTMLPDNMFTIIPVVEPDTALVELVNALKSTNTKIIIVSLKDFTGKNELLLGLQNYAIVLNCKRKSNYDNAIYTALNYINRLYDRNFDVLILPVNGNVSINKIEHVADKFSHYMNDIIIKDSPRMETVPVTITLFNYIKYKYIKYRYKTDLSDSASSMYIFKGTLIPYMIIRHHFSFTGCLARGITIR